MVIAADGSTQDYIVTIVNPGSLDTTFGIGGIVATTIGSGNNVAYALGLQSDGKIVVAGVPTAAPMILFL